LLGRTLLKPSGCLIAQCGYTYSVRLVKLLCRSHGVTRSDPTQTLWLSDCTVWIHLLSKAGEAALLSHGVARSDPTQTLWLSDCTVWIHLLSKAGAASLLIPRCCCNLTLGLLDYWDECSVCGVSFH
jgi:hypothetical protein